MLASDFRPVCHSCGERMALFFFLRAELKEKLKNKTNQKSLMGYGKRKKTRENLLGNGKDSKEGEMMDDAGDFPLKVQQHLWLFQPSQDLQKASGEPWAECGRKGF